MLHYYRVRLFPNTFFGVDRPVQRDLGDLEYPANFGNRVFRIIIEGLGNCQLFAGEGFRPATSSSSGSCSRKPCLCSIPDQVSLKFRKRTKDMKDQLTATGGINVLCEAFKPNPTFLKSGQGSNEMGQERPKEKGGHSPTRGENYPATNFDQQVRSAQQIEDLGFASKPLITPGR